MNALTFAELLDKPVHTKLAALFNTEQSGASDFQIVSRYSVSKFVSDDIGLDYEETALNLGKHYGLDFRYIGGGTIQANIENERLNSLAHSREILFESILSDLATRPKSTEQDQMIALALWGLRGSADKSLYAVDGKDDGKGHVDRIFHIVFKFSRIPIKPLNKRPPGEKRDDQLRVDNEWFYLRVYESLKSVNSYRAEILHQIRANK